MNKMDSVLTAARAFADASRKPWAEIQPYYRALQQDRVDGEAWIPKSVGRTIWFAHPNFITRLMIAFASTNDPARSDDVLKAAQYLACDAHNQPGSIEKALYPFLIDPNSDLHSVEFHQDAGRIIINTARDGSILFARALPAQFRRVITRTILDGEVFRDLARNVVWRTEDQPPFGTVSLVRPYEQALVRAELDELDGGGAN
jgi:hypothetical protein